MTQGNTVKIDPSPTQYSSSIPPYKSLGQGSQPSYQSQLGYQGGPPRNSYGGYQQPSGGNNWNQYPYYVQSSLPGMNQNLVNPQIPPPPGTSNPPSAETKNAYFGNTSININFPMYMTPYPPMNYPQRYSYHGPYQGSHYVQQGQYPLSGNKDENTNKGP